MRQELAVDFHEVDEPVELVVVIVDITDEMDEYEYVDMEVEEVEVHDVNEGGLHDAELIDDEMVDVDYIHLVEAPRIVDDEEGGFPVGWITQVQQALVTDDLDY